MTDIASSFRLFSSVLKNILLQQHKQIVERSLSKPDSETRGAIAEAASALLELPREHRWRAMRVAEILEGCPEYAIEEHLSGLSEAEASAYLDILFERATQFVTGGVAAEATEAVDPASTSSKGAPEWPIVVFTKEGAGFDAPLPHIGGWYCEQYPDDCNTLGSRLRHLAALAKAFLGGERPAGFYFDWPAEISKPEELALLADADMLSAIWSSGTIWTWEQIRTFQPIKHIWAAFSRGEAVDDKILALSDEDRDSFEEFRRILPHGW